MKTTIVLLFALVSFAASAQPENTSLPPFKRFPTMPVLNLLLSDSTTKFTKEEVPKDKPVLLMLFSPDCDHCQHETQEFVKNKHVFNDIQLLMVTTSPLYRMNQFVEEYKVKEIPNVIVGKDIYYLLLPFYDVKNFPYLALYNKNGDLITTAEGAVPLETLMKLFQ